MLVWQDHRFSSDKTHRLHYREQKICAPAPGPQIVHPFEFPKTSLHRNRQVLAGMAAGSSDRMRR